MERTYRGSCHCGAIHFEVLPLERTFFATSALNSSVNLRRCRRFRPRAFVGALGVPPALYRERFRRKRA